MPGKVIVNQPLSDKDPRYLYPEKLLQLALQRSLGAAAPEVVRAEVSMSRERVFEELIHGSLIHVMAEAPKPHWESQLLPVRIPIRKGLQGYRLFLIRQQDQAAMAGIQTLEELKKLPTGSGSQWSTRVALEEAGFDVRTSGSYEGLFRMLSLGRFITFSRGINEAYRELDEFSGEYPDLAVDNQLVLYLPLPTYFFVTPRYPELAGKIREGLEMLIDSEEFDAFFCENHRADIEQANLNTRRFFCISNPNLGPETPLQDPRYWTSKACGLKPSNQCSRRSAQAGGEQP